MDQHRPLTYCRGHVDRRYHHESILQAARCIFASNLTKLWPTMASDLNILLLVSYQYSNTLGLEEYHICSW